MYILHVCWSLLIANAFGLPDSGVANHRAGALVLRRELGAFYRHEQEQRPGEDLYILSDFRLETFGTATEPVLHAKAADGNGCAIRVLRLALVCRDVRHAIQWIGVGGADDDANDDNWTNVQMSMVVVVMMTAMMVMMMTVLRLCRPT